MKQYLAKACCAVATVLLLSGCQGLAPQGAMDMNGKRIVFLGDSITDGNSYPTLFRQALAEAGKPVPICTCAGIGGDTAKGMRARLDRDVLVHKPDYMTLSAGVNDANRNVPLDDYVADVRAILDRLLREKVQAILMTPSILSDKCPEQARQNIAKFADAIRQLASEYGVPLADVNASLAKAKAESVETLEADGIHPNYAGHRVMARIVLDAFGFTDVPLPAALRAETYPGLVTPWRLKAVADAKAVLDETSVAAVKPDDSWATLALPEPGKIDNWWSEQTRVEGFALSVEKLAGKAPHYLGYATLKADQAKTVYFNTGAHVQTIWLNGKRIYKGEGWTGYHAGKERIAAQLQAGDNTVVIETGAQFFLSVTDTNRW